MHHRYFECKYAGLGAAALDVYFGTFKARMNEAEKGTPGAYKAGPAEQLSAAGMPPCRCTAVQWGLAILAGFGPVWAAQLVNALVG